jgi:polyferredoxin
MRAANSARTFPQGRRSHGGGQGRLHRLQGLRARVPTGIDIRNGTQLECVNCTACIDACDHMMGSVGLPTGLIRYASEDEIARKQPFRFTCG